MYVCSIAGKPYIVAVCCIHSLAESCSVLQEGVNICVHCCGLAVPRCSVLQCVARRTTCMCALVQVSCKSLQCFAGAACSVFHCVRCSVLQAGLNMCVLYRRQAVMTLTLCSVLQGTNSFTNVMVQAIRTLA